MSDFGSASIDIDSEMEEPHGVTSARCILLVPLTTWRDAKCSTGDLCVIAFGVCERLGVASHLTWLDLMQRALRDVSAAAASAS